MKNWDNIYLEQTCKDAVGCDVLRENMHLLPQGYGRALDLACGMGGNAISLAQGSKLEVFAWDISSVAIMKLAIFATDNNLKITAEARDVETYPPGNPPPPALLCDEPREYIRDEEHFDVITVSSFLHRPTFRSLIQSLKPNGILYYQTLIKDKTNPEVGPSNPNFLLDKNELLHLCKDLEILVYREEGTTGCIDQGWRNKAMIVAKRVA